MIIAAHRASQMFKRERSQMKAVRFLHELLTFVFSSAGAYALKQTGWILLLTLVIVSAGHDLHSSLSFTAKQRSELPQEVPNKDKGNGNPPEVLM